MITIAAMQYPGRIPSSSTELGGGLLLDEAKNMLQRLREGYSFRCQIAHGDPKLIYGGTMLAPGESYTRMMEIEARVRDVLKRIILDQNMLKEFGGAVPKALLENLPLVQQLDRYFDALPRF
jgi:hypothetical protein